jgi:glycosyltransferase 2 family protein
MKTVLKRLQPVIGTIISLLLVYLVLFSPQLRPLFAGEIGFADAFFGSPRIGMEDLRTAGEQIQYSPAIFAIILLTSSLFLRAWRWQLMIKQLGPVGYWTVFHGVNLGYLLNNVLPLRAGELLRAVIVGGRASLSTTSIFTTVVAERVFDLAGLGILFGIITWQFPFPEWLQTAGLSFASGVVVFLIFALVLAHSRQRLERWHLAVSKRGKVIRTVGELILRLVDGLSVLKSTSAMIHVFWSTLALWGIYIGTMKFVLDAFQFTDGTYPLLAGEAWLPAAAMTVITSLGFAIPSAPGGVGTYHGAVLLGLSWFNVPEGLAVIFATVMHGLNYVTLTLWGVISLFAMRLKFSDIVRTAKRPQDVEQPQI